MTQRIVRTEKELEKAVKEGVYEIIIDNKESNRVKVFTTLILESTENNYN